MKAGTIHARTIRTAMPAAAALALVLSAGPASTQRPDAARQLLAAVDSAWEAGGAVELRRDLVSRLGRRPEDRAARLALATLDRLAYRDSAATHGFSALLDGRVGGRAVDAIRVRAALGLGLSHAQAWRTDDADEWLDRAAAWADTVGVPDAAAEALLALATVRARTTGVAHALQLTDLAEARLATGGGRARGLLQCTRAALFARSGIPGAQALADSGRALAIAVRDRRLEAACLSASAQDHDRAGYTRLAIPLLEEAAALQRVTGHHGGLAASQQWLGYLYMGSGRYGAALGAYDEAVREAVLVGNRSALAWSHIGLAELAFRLDDLQTAERQIAAAQVVLAEIGDLWGLAAAHSQRGDIALASGRHDRARNSYELALNMAAERNPIMAATVWRKLARVEARSSRTDVAAAHLHTIDSLSIARHQRGWAVERDFDRGLLALDRGAADSAAVLFRSFLDRTHESQPERRFDGRVRLAQALALQGNSVAAAIELGNAMDEFHEWGQGAPDRMLRTTAFHRRRLDVEPDAAVAAVINALITAGHPVEALSLLERHRSRDLLERITLRRALITTSDTADAAGTLLPATIRLDIEALRRAIPVQSALVSFHAPRGAAASWAFVVSEGNVDAVRLPPADSLAHTFERFAQLLETGATASSLAGQIADLVVRPVMQRLPAGTQRLTIVPDGVFSRLPFDALVVDGRFMIERFELSIAPSAAYVLRMWTLPPTTGRSGMVVFADPTAPRTRDAGAGDAFDRAFRADAALRPPLEIPPLPAARREARRVARYGAPANVLVRGEANEAALRGLADSAHGVLHFATHAVVEERSLLRTALVLAPGAGSDGLMRPDALAGLNLAADVVVLSGCRTAGGHALAIEGIQGLAVPLLGSGVRSVVATQWQVRDGSMIRLLEDFYAAMAQGMTAGPALRHARLASMQRGEPVSVWAAPVLIGDPAALPLLAMPPLYGRFWLVGAVALFLAGGLGLVVFRRTQR